jgi:hypothetical protein
MRMVMVAAAALAGVWAATPARGADVATLACVERGMPAAAKYEIGQAAAAMVRGNAASPPPASADAALSFAADTCARQHRWSPQARADAVQATLGSLSVAAARQVVAGQGGDPDAAARALATLTPAQQAWLVAREPSATTALVGALRRANLIGNDSARNRPVIVLVSFMAMYETKKASFARA